MLRARARANIDQGAVTDGYKADRLRVLGMLNEALATELVCVLRYRRHYFTAPGIHGQSVANEFLEHATEELGHADRIAARIVQLGGEPDFDPTTLRARSHAEYVPGSTLAEMIREDLVAERVAIESYSEMVRFLGDDDPTTRQMMVDILGVEEKHAEEMVMLLQRVAP